ncbi:lactoylglutathione lyase family protein [Flavobacterium fryxellicola]|uniref:Glyoxalase n=1 Tax=Flavobacterium fryxellicola TaxID=249352 RepID=A0A167Y015_9FLAO|nr:VOC family protein [Flavobacterium fryxellicola]OAB28877.1 glyoxalase [Flavobacterium fryxellicola]SHN60628.1 lactoylglutathione lyase family protein [Flavobacterium fryxellicola]
MATQTKYPKAFSHIGITVPTIKEAVEFYSEVMGWYIIMEPSTVKKEKETAIGQMCIDVFGEDWEEFEIVHLATSDGTGIELFSFPHGSKEAPEFNPFNTGLFHFCIHDPNIEDLIAKIVSYGGKQRMPIREYYPNEKPFKMCYVQDPFGIVFEIYTHSYELTYFSGAYSK